MIFFNLPRELLTKIFEMDDTYRNKFNFCLKELILKKIEKRQKLLKKDIIREINILGRLPKYHREYPDSELTAGDYIDFHHMPNGDLRDVFWIDDLMENAYLSIATMQETNDAYLHNAIWFIRLYGY